MENPAFHAMTYKLEQVHFSHELFQSQLTAHTKCSRHNLHFQLQYTSDKFSHHLSTVICKLERRKGSHHIALLWVKNHHSIKAEHGSNGWDLNPSESSLFPLEIPTCTCTKSKVHTHKHLWTVNKMGGTDWQGPDLTGHCILKIPCSFQARENKNRKNKI